MRRSRLLSSCFLTALTVGAAALAQKAGSPQFAVDWHTIDGGGGTSTGAQFSVSGTIGQHDAGGPMTGKSFSVQGGFWAGGEGPMPKPCTGDIAPPPNGDGQVNVDDLLAVINGWGACPAPCPPTCRADIAPPPNGDCQVNVDDLLLIINRWGPCPK